MDEDMGSRKSFDIKPPHGPNLDGKLVRTAPESPVPSEGGVSPAELFERTVREAKEHQMRGDFNAAIEQYNAALKHSVGIPYGLMAFAYGNMGRCYHALEIFDRALNYHQLHLDLATQGDDDEMQCVALTNMGLAQYAMGNMQEAINLHLKCLATATELGDQQAQMRSFANLGNAYGSMGKYKEAVVYHEQQLRVAQALRDTDAEMRAAFNLENDHNSLKHYDVANRYRSKKNHAQTLKLARSSLNEDLGDKRPGAEIASGWLIKHVGGDKEGPKKVSDVRRWCVLQNGVFSYAKHVAATLKAQRYIRMTDVTSVEEYEVEGDDADQAVSFRILVGERAYYFTCDSAKECRDWIEALNRARSGMAQFGRARGITMNMVTNRPFLTGVHHPPVSTRAPPELSSGGVGGTKSGAAAASAGASPTTPSYTTARDNFGFSTAPAMGAMFSSGTDAPLEDGREVNNPLFDKRANSLDDLSVSSQESEPAAGEWSDNVSYKDSADELADDKPAPKVVAVGDDLYNSAASVRQRKSASRRGRQARAQGDTDSSEDEDEATNRMLPAIQQQPQLFNPHQAWDKQPTPLDAGKTTFKVQLIGSAVIEVPPGEKRPPSSHEIHAIYLDIDRKKSANLPKLVLTLNDDSVDIHTKANPSKGITSKRVLFHLMKDIVNVVSFGDALILVIGTHPGEQISYKAFVYSPSSAIDAATIKDNLTSRVAGPGTGPRMPGRPAGPAQPEPAHMESVDLPLGTPAQDVYAQPTDAYGQNVSATRRQTLRSPPAYDDNNHIRVTPRAVSVDDYDVVPEEMRRSILELRGQNSGQQVVYESSAAPATPATPYEEMDDDERSDLHGRFPSMKLRERQGTFVAGTSTTDGVFFTDGGSPEKETTTEHLFLEDSPERETTTDKHKFLEGPHAKDSESTPDYATLQRKRAADGYSMPQQYGSGGGPISAGATGAWGGVQGRDDDEEFDIDLQDPAVNDAALKIQSSFRGHQVRKAYAERRRTQDLSMPQQQAASTDGTAGMDETKAATLIQASFRGHKARKDSKVRFNEAKARGNSKAAKAAEETAEETAMRLRAESVAREEEIRRLEAQAAEAEAMLARLDEDDDFMSML